MSNYVADYSGSQINGVIGLFVGKGLDQVTGLVQRNADGTFSVGSGGGGSVTDVTVNGSSVVNAQGVAVVSVPTAAQIVRW